MPHVEEWLQKAYELSDKLGVPRDYLPALLERDDWAFIVLVHTLFEAALAQALTRSIVAWCRPCPDEVSIRRACEDMPMTDGKSGKIALATSLHLIDQEEADFLRNLGELRNRMAHDVGMVTIDLGKYYEGLDSDSKRTFLKQYCFVDVVDENADALAARVRDKSYSVRIGLWRTSIGVLALLSVGIGLREVAGRSIEHFVRGLGFEDLLLEDDED